MTWRRPWPECSGTSWRCERISDCPVEAVDGCWRCTAQAQRVVARPLERGELVVWDAHYQCDDRHGKTDSEAGHQIHAPLLAYLRDHVVEQALGGLDHRRLERPQMVGLERRIHQSALTTMIRRIGVQQHRGAATSHGATHGRPHLGVLHQLADAPGQSLARLPGSGGQQARAPLDISQNRAHVVVSRDEPGAQCLVVLRTALIAQVGEQQVRTGDGCLLAGDQCIDPAGGGGVDHRCFCLVMGSLQRSTGRHPWPISAREADVACAHGSRERPGSSGHGTASCGVGRGVV